MNNKQEPFFWKIINNISKGSSPLTREEFIDDEYVPWVIMKVLSYDITLCQELMSVNYKFGITPHSKYAHYLTLFHLIPKRYRSFKKPDALKITDVEKEQLKHIENYFNIRRDLVPEYLIYLSEKDIEQIINYQKSL